jgi:hypothetical protein
MEGVTTYQSRSRMKDLRHSGRDTSSVSESDAAGVYSLWQHELEGKRVMTGFTVDGVGYRAASEREQAHTGKAWIAFSTPCEGGGDLREDLPVLIRMGWRAQAERITTVGDREAAVHRFAFDDLAAVDDPRARKIAAWVRDHRVSGHTVTVTTAADDGELLGLHMRNRGMTTCGAKPMYCRSRTDLHSFGRPIGAKPAVPPEDQVHRLPTTPPRHG